VFVGAGGACGASIDSARWHATDRPAIVSSGGRTVAHDSTARWQRGWYGHPDGTRAGFGGAPGIVNRSDPWASSRGTDRSNASV
jgi:hypothetical protein